MAAAGMIAPQAASRMTQRWEISYMYVHLNRNIVTWPLLLLVLALTACPGSPPTNLPRPPTLEPAQF